jgi:hypothetical protein
MSAPYPFIKKTPAWQGGVLGGKKGFVSGSNNTPRQPEPSTPLHCFGKAHEPYERGDCSTCHKASPCALHTPLWTSCEDKRRRKSLHSLVNHIHQKHGYSIRELEAHYKERFDI